ncbi:MAG: hypothetical protein EOP11_09005, partial [Proteobacteria bacterium]
MGKILYSLILILCLAPALSHAAAEVAPSFSLDGTLYTSPAGTSPLLDSNVRIRVQILPASGSCVLYDEQQTVDTTNSEGAFSIQVGSPVGSPRRVSGSDSGNAMTTVFQNKDSIPGNNSGCTVSAAAGSTRRVRVTITPNGGIADTLSPDMVLSSVPASLVAETLQGVARDGFLQLGAGSLSQANVENVFSSTNYSSLTALLAGGGSSSGGSNSSSYAINAGTGGAGGINFNINGVTKAVLDYTGNMGIGTSTPSARLSVEGSSASTPAVTVKGAGSQTADLLQLKDNSGTTLSTFKSDGSLGIGVASPTAKLHLVGASGATLRIVDGNQALGSVLTSDANGVASWAAPATAVGSLAVSAPIVKGGTATAPTLSIPAASTTADGFLSSADWNTFSGKLSSALASAKLWVGNGAGEATAVAPSGDVAMDNAGAFTVSAIRGRSVATTLPTLSGQVYRYDSGSTSWKTDFLGLADIRSTSVPGNSILPATACTADKTLYWNSFTDQFSCQSIGVAGSQVDYGSQTQKTFFAAPSGADGVPTFRALSSADLPAGVASQWASSGSNISYSLGNVGIGSTSPGQKLDVGGTVKAFDFSSGWGSAVNPAFAVNYGQGMFAINSGADLAFSNNSLERVRITNAGNVSIGTTTATNRLTVYDNGNGASNGVISVKNAFNGANARGYFSAEADTSGIAATMGIASSTFLDATNWPDVDAGSAFLRSAASGGLRISSTTAGAGAAIRFFTHDGTSIGERMRVARNGNVGIGSTAPTQALDVVGSIAVSSGINSGASVVSLFSRAGFGTAGAPSFSFSSDPDTGMFHPLSNELGLASAGVERVRIDSTGRVGIGSTAPAVGLDLSTLTDGLAIPRGTTAQQPAARPAGTIRWNTDTPGLELWTGSTWSSLATSGSASYLASTGGTLTGGLTITTGGLNNSSSGITNAGSITGVGTNLTGASALTVAAGGSAQNLDLKSSTTGSVNLSSGSGVGLSVVDSGAANVNYVTIKGAETNVAPTIGVEGETNVSLNISPKGTGRTNVSGALMLTNGNLGVAGPTTTTNTITLSGSAARKIGMEAGATVGNSLTIASGSAKTGSTDLNAGDLILSSGTSQGTGTSKIQLSTAIASATGTTTNAIAPRMTILGSFVGIGTTVPASTLDVYGPNANFTWPFGNATFSVNGTNTTTGAGILNLTAGTTTSLKSGQVVVDLTKMVVGTNTTNSSIPLHLQTNAQTRLQIDTAGNVAIGPTAAVSPFDVNGNAPVGGGQTAMVRQTATDAASSARSTLVLRNDGTGSSTEFNLIGQSSTGALTFSVRQNGSTTFNNWIMGPTYYGGSGPSANVTIDSTSNATKGFVLLAPTTGNV